LEIYVSAFYYVYTSTGGFGGLKNLKKPLMGNRGRSICIIKEGSHCELGNKMGLQRGGEIMDIPSIHALHGLDASTGVKNNRIVY